MTSGMANLTENIERVKKLAFALELKLIVTFQTQERPYPRIPKKGMEDQVDRVCPQPELTNEAPFSATVGVFFGEGTSSLRKALGVSMEDALERLIEGLVREVREKMDEHNQQAEKLFKATQ